MCLYQHLPAAHSLSKMHISGKENKESCKPVQSLHNQIWTLLGPVLATMKRLEKENNVMIAEINMSKRKKASTNKRHWDFRGHRDDCQFKSNRVKDSSGSKAKFVDVLNHRVKAGDTVLEKHLNTCSISASYISKSRKIR